MYVILSLDNFTELLLLPHLSRTGEAFFPITQFSVPTNLLIYLLLLSFLVMLLPLLFNFIVMRLFLKCTFFLLTSGFHAIAMSVTVDFQTLF
jgi:hypothetical protein